MKQKLKRLSKSSVFQSRDTSITLLITFNFEQLQVINLKLIVKVNEFNFEFSSQINNVVAIFNQLNAVSFNQLNATLQTDETFRRKQNPQHHVSQSPLTEFVGMVTQFPYDYMHLVCLGVARRLLNNWTHGPSVTGFRKCDIPQISESLLSIRALIPSEFSRKTRSLKDLAYWKATD